MKFQKNHKINLGRKASKKTRDLQRKKALEFINRKGYRNSAETRKKLSLANKNNPKLIGKNNPMWNEKVGYQGLHLWVVRKKGKARACKICKSSDKTKRYHWANISRSYLRDENDWISLCVPCHKKADLKKINLRRNYD